mmetsp:Transcript_45075/g.174905  ORF Transcript_45075/g.174905 Transcript_45075/m.174905 type:complete len:99 (-) Transcript_45075:322-618(-)
MGFFFSFRGYGRFLGGSIEDNFALANGERMNRWKLAMSRLVFRTPSSSVFALGSNTIASKFDHCTSRAKVTQQSAGRPFNHEIHVISITMLFQRSRLR